MQSSLAGAEKTNRELPRDPATPLLGIAPKELKAAGSQTDICAFTGSELATVKRWRRPKCCPPSDRIQQMGCTGWGKHTYTRTHTEFIRMLLFISHCSICRTGTCKRGLPQAVYLEGTIISALKRSEAQTSATTHCHLKRSKPVTKGQILRDSARGRNLDNQIHRRRK